jgi:hypothetical protein
MNGYTYRRLRLTRKILQERDRQKNKMIQQQDEQIRQLEAQIMNLEFENRALLRSAHIASGDGFIDNLFDHNDTQP